MLNKIIPFIDTQLQALSYFQTIYGLAERLQTSEDDKQKTFPAVFKGNDNYIQIELEKLACYHRQTDSLYVNELPAEDTRGCTKAFEITYPMVLVGCLQHDKGCQTYESDQIANSIAYKIFQSKFPKEILREIKAWSIELFLKGVDTDRYRVWESEYENIENPITFDKVFFMIKYDLKIKASTECLNILEC